MAHHDGTHAHQDHPFHLVSPSPWPVRSAAALLLLALGGAMYMHQIQPGAWVAGLGFTAILICMYGWWRDVVREAQVDQAHTREVSRGLRMGMGLFILSEVLFFAAFFWAFFNASLFPLHPLSDIWDIKPGSWPPEGIKTFDPWDIPFLNTLILLLSGTTVTWAHHALLENKREDVVRALTYTVLLGVTFTSLQAFEYFHAGFGFRQGVYASTFYMATGFHGFHVIVGTIFLTVCLLRARKGDFTPRQHLGLEFAAWYWHFVDVVWLFLFVCVYWWGGQ